MITTETSVIVGFIGVQIPEALDTALWQGLATALLDQGYRQLARHLAVHVLPLRLVAFFWIYDLHNPLQLALILEEDTIWVQTEPAIHGAAGDCWGK